jgi:two-component system, LuxR family, sensor kinase FixL
MRQVRTVTRLAPHLPPVRGDAIQLQQVFLNLILNASHSMMANESGHRVLTVSTVCDDRSVKAIFSDNGPGFSPETKNRLFESFFTTRADGIGLGLPISRSIARAHEGDLWADRNAEGGAVFHVRLPALDQVRQ